jgi:methionyl-tRNA synthetase
MFLLKVEGKNYTCGLMHRLVSSTKEWALREGKDWEPYKDQETNWSFHWEGDIVFHCVIFPAMLKAEGSIFCLIMFLPMSLELRRK